MSLENLIDRINSEENKKVVAIKDEYDTLTKTAQDNIFHEAESIVSKLWEDTKNDDPKLENALNIKWDLIANKKRLSLKRGILDATYDSLLESFLNMSRKDYIDWICGKLTSLKIDLDDTHMFLGNLNSEYVDDAFINELKEKFGVDSLKFKVKDDICGGFVLKKEKIEIDVSFKTVISDLKEKEDINVSKILFG